MTIPLAHAVARCGVVTIPGLYDAWARSAVGGPHIFLATIAGGVVRDRQCLFWDAVRQHPLYIDDRDYSEQVSPKPNLAYVRFLCPSPIRSAVQTLGSSIPLARS